MNARYRFRLLLSIAVMTLSILACGLPDTTPTVLPTTYIPPTTEPTPGESPAGTESPTSPPPPGWLPSDTIALYSSGSWEAPRLYALNAGGISTDLGRTLSPGAVASRSGRWVAQKSTPSPATSVMITSLETGTTYSIPVTPGADVYGMAFDNAETRLAFMELGGLTEAGTSWSIVSVNLGDGSTAAFGMVSSVDAEMLPGFPLGWTGGNELVLSTFAPFTEGNWAGAWGVTLPPGTLPAPLDTLSRRVLIPMGDYRLTLRLSPDCNRLLYLNRDFGYTPAGYEPMAYDLAVNQLGTLNLPGGAPTLVVNVTDGGALAGDAAWSPDSAQILFAQGVYVGPSFGSLTFKVRDAGGAVRDAGAVPLPAGGDLNTLDWCRPSQALAVVIASDSLQQLHMVNLDTGASTFLTSASSISVLGCTP